MFIFIKECVESGVAERCLEDIAVSHGVNNLRACPQQKDLVDPLNFLQYWLKWLEGHNL